MCKFPFWPNREEAKKVVCTGIYSKFQVLGQWVQSREKILLGAQLPLWAQKYHMGFLWTKLRFVFGGHWESGAQGKPGPSKLSNTESSSDQ